MKSLKMEDQYFTEIHPFYLKFIIKNFEIFLSNKCRYEHNEICIVSLVKTLKVNFIILVLFDLIEPNPL